MKVHKIIDYIVNWLKEQNDKAGLKGFVVGVSGGIDSAVTSTICAKTGQKVLVLNMPIYQGSEQNSLAERHIKWLKNYFSEVQGKTIDLTPIFQSIEKTFPTDIQDDLTMANTRSRLRMLTLYAFANHHKMLVTGTGNKIEDFGVGFFTKYGDGGVDIAPIADLMKSEVYQLGQELGIIQEILRAKPMDGLWFDNRSDEDQLGATYDELEWAMNFVEKDSSENQLTNHQKKILNLYRTLNRSNRHKTQPIPVAKIPKDLK